MSSSSFREAESADRRLVILRILNESPGYEANSSVLRMALSWYGHTVSHDQLHEDLGFLSQRGLIGLRDMASIRVAVLSARGADVAQGRASEAGVKKPEPGL